MSVAIWLGNATPIRSIRWLDGALITGAAFGKATAIVAGDGVWHDLAADRAARVGVGCVAVKTELKLDYLGWAQIVAAVCRELKTKTVIVDEASRPERFPEVAAIAEQLDATQLTNVVALAPDGDLVHASRVAGRELQTLRVRGPAVFGVRIAGNPIDEHPTPIPSRTMKKLDLAGLGLDAMVLGHRALPPRTTAQLKKTVDRVSEHIAVHLAPRGR